MTATEVLRRMLDERGVEHYEHEAPATDCIAFFDGNGWHDCWESVDGEVNVTFSMTPEQAIAATLGRGTCRFEQIPEALYDDIECSECGVALWGFQMDIAGEGCPTRPRYCPNCGRRVVE